MLESLPRQGHTFEDVQLVTIIEFALLTHDLASGHLEASLDARTMCVCMLKNCEQRWVAGSVGDRSVANEKLKESKVQGHDIESPMDSRMDDVAR